MWVHGLGHQVLGLGSQVLVNVTAIGDGIMGTGNATAEHSEHQG